MSESEPSPPPSQAGGPAVTIGSPPAATLMSVHPPSTTKPCRSILAGLAFHGRGPEVAYLHPILLLVGRLRAAREGDKGKAPQVARAKPAA
jgi:hypothetical protein